MFLLSLSLSCLQPSQSDEPDIDDPPIGLVLILVNSTDATILCPDKTAVVIEGSLVVEMPVVISGSRRSPIIGGSVTSRDLCETEYDDRK